MTETDPSDAVPLGVAPAAAAAEPLEASDGPGAADELAEFRRLTPLLVVVLAFVVVAGVTDLILDRPATWRSWHVAFEVMVVLVSLGFAVVLWRGWRRTVRALGQAHAELARTTRTLAERQRERDAWRRSAEAERAGFGRAVDAQFAAWGLTPTEREVASLLLQGLGHKQIAGRTGRSERTVRQHAVAIYEKSGIGGRAELAAFFLHDLLPASDSPSGDV
jgi:DNA-binding CsgD family transcriptional regulator